jgi:hypothetical protein
MKRQARPFVVETKRSRKAPTNMWASTPLLREELAAASVAETKADAIFADKSAKEGLRAAEPQRRILPSLIVEAPPEPIALEEPAPRRRATRDDADITEKPKRGRPRRIVVEAAEVQAFTPARPAPAREVAERGAASGKPARAPARKPEPAKTVAAASHPPQAVSTTRVAAPGAERLAPRARAPKADTAALPPGQRWKRRLPQLLW